MSDPRSLRPGRGGRPSPASLGLVRVDADFPDEYPGSVMSARTQDERAQLLGLLAKVLARAADVAAEPPEPLKGLRIRPARLDRPRPST